MDTGERRGMVQLGEVDFAKLLKTEANGGEDEHDEEDTGDNTNDKEAKLLKTATTDEANGATAGVDENVFTAIVKTDQAVSASAADETVPATQAEDAVDSQGIVAEGKILDANASSPTAIEEKAGEEEKDADAGDTQLASDEFAAFIMVRLVIKTIQQITSNCRRSYENKSGHHLNTDIFTAHIIHTYIYILQIILMLACALVVVFSETFSVALRH